MLKFSVIMSIYKSDVPEYLHIALESMMNQTRRPDEIVIVGDGPVSAELEKVVQSFKSKVARSKSKVSKTAKDASSIQESSTRRYEYFKLEVEGLSEAKKVSAAKEEQRTWCCFGCSGGGSEISVSGADGLG